MTDQPTPAMPAAGPGSTPEATPATGARGTSRRSLRAMFVELPWLAGVLLAVCFGITAVVAAKHVGLPIRDPEGSFGPRLIFPFTVLVLALAADICARVLYRTRLKGTDWRMALEQVKTERLQWGRYGLALVGFASFHVVYLSYRNLKSFLVFIRDVNYDAWLSDLDRWMTFGANPAEVLHTVLGTGVAAHVLDSIYLAFLPYVPISVAVALMWSRSLRQGFWYVTALSLNWILGTISYYVFPSLGPIYVDPELFADLPSTGVSSLQQWLETHRLSLLNDPVGTDSIQSIAAFASLHVSIVFTAFLILALLGYRRLAIVHGVLVVLTTLATVYFGWHYILDDIVGVGMGVAAVWLAAWMTGVDATRLARWRRYARRDPVEPESMATTAAA